MCRMAVDQEGRSFVGVDAVRVLQTGEAVEILSTRILPTHVVFPSKSLLTIYRN